MKIMIIGSGGREHALAWKLGKSPQVQQIFVVPGNHGISKTPKVKILPGNLDDPLSLLTLTLQNNISFVIVGPEKPLSEGIVDLFQENNILVLGPNKNSARLESSKIFSKEFMIQNAIPTARFKDYSCYEDAYNDLPNWDFKTGIAIKTDTLASGKGVVVTHNIEEAQQVLFNFMKNPSCTVKTDRILIEEKLIGKEVSALALCDGETFIPLGYACDYKRVFNNDQGPNTGGMGGYSPTNWPNSQCKTFINQYVFKAVMQGMKKIGCPYKGILFAGLIIHDEKVNVLEFNVRFGDPEAQILLPLIDEDLFPYFLAAAKGNLKDMKKYSLNLKEECSVHVVMASRGYPSTDKTPMSLGEIIDYPYDLDPSNNISNRNLLFFSGVKENTHGKLINSGGRVLGITSLGANLNDARELAYQNLSMIKFNHAHWRTDIGT